MENKNPLNHTLTTGDTSASIRLRKMGGNTLCRGHNQANFLDGHKTRLLLCNGRKKRCDKGSALRLDIIMARSLYPRIFNKHQQKILKEALEECKGSLYVK